MKKLKKNLIRLIIISLVLFILGGSIGAGIIYSFYSQLPFVSLETYDQSVNSKIYDEYGRIILELHKGENRTRKVNITEISSHVLNAVISIEDKRFYEHFGIDMKRIIKSFMVLIKERGRLTMGGSTITQQLARNAFLSLDKTWTRKIKEIMLAIKLEKEFTKDEILTLYLNEIPFGEGAFGIESAAVTFFGKHAADLDIAESALLAGVLKGQSAYSPFQNYDKSIARRNLVLKEMYKDGKITRSEYVEAKASQPELIGRKRKLCHAPYYIYSHLIPDLKERYGESMVVSGGLEINTTINLDIQKIAEETFENADIFRTYPDLNGAMIVAEVKTGKLLAIVGGKDFSEKNQFNRAFDAVRQPGSLMKPIVYLTAFDNGIPPNKIVSDVPREYFDPWTQTVWQPQNYEGRYHGPVILRMALENSYNIVAVELLKETGAKNVIDMAHRLGISSHLRETLSLALGSYSINPIEMAQAYSVFANTGLKVDFQHILSVADSNGFDIEKYRYKSEKVVNPSSVAILNDILQGVVKYGSGTRARIEGYNIAGKTGTTDDFTNAWFCGYTPNLLVLTYFGHDMPKTIGEHTSGGRIAAPVVAETMKKIFKKFPERFPSEDFPITDELVEVEICRESGLKATDDCALTIDTLFYKGAEPKMLCNFHDPEITDAVT
ncbi:MAG: transglycosylase domain-containing protein, partial [Candidatus Muiribacteriaceae bacterium]